MNEQQVREIAEAAFRAHFGDIDVCRINIRRGFDHEDDPVVDLTLIYDGKYEQLNANGLLDVRLDINHNVWRDAEDSPGLADDPFHPQVRTPPPASVRTRILRAEARPMALPVRRPADRRRVRAAGTAQCLAEDQRPQNAT